jgi:hypothetical protein
MRNPRDRRSRALLWTRLTAVIAASTLVGWYARELHDGFAARLATGQARPQLSMPLPPAKPLGEAPQDVASLAALEPASGAAYPPAIVETIQTTCHQRRDVPASSMDAYCGCYVARLQSDVSWQNWLLLDAAIRAKSPQGLGTDEKKILGVVFQDTFYCYQKYSGE